MSLMAGFDLIIEVSRPALEKLIKANIGFGGTRLTPPFELQIPVTGAVAGSFNVIVNAVQLQLTGIRGADLNLAFSAGSVVLDSPPLHVSLLEGNIVVSAELGLVASSNRRSQLPALALGHAVVDVRFSSGSEYRIVSTLARAPMKPAAFKRLLRTQLVDFVRAQGRQVISEDELSILPDAIRSISSLALRRLDVRNFGDASMTVRGLLSARKTGANPGVKTVSAIQFGHDVAISIGARAFQRPADRWFDQWKSEEVNLGDIRNTFADGWIDLEGTIERSGTAYKARGTFHSTVALSITASTLASHLAVDPPSLDVDLPYYSYQVTDLLGPIGLVIEDALKSGTDSFLERLKSATTVAGESFDHVVVSAEGISFSRAIDVPVQEIASARSVEISGSVTTTESKEVSSGTYHIATGCLRGDYPYTEYLQSQTGIFAVVPRLLAQPISLVWGVLWDNGATFPMPIGAALLAGSGGMVTLNGMECHYPAPLPQGTIVRHPVHLGYDLLPHGMKLSNDPAEGIYSVTLFVRATDALGHVEVASTRITFFGQAVQIGGGYRDRLWQCYLKEVVKDVALQPIKRVRPALQFGKEESEQLTAFIRLLAAKNTPATDNLLVHAKLALGSVYYDALFSGQPAATARADLAGKETS